MKINASRIVSVIASRAFFRVTVLLLIAEAAWIALTGHYPMAFDEDFHLGIIRLYAHHISPFWGNQPAGAGAFGAVARDPSYLYQYLMSFPYRLISLFTHDQNIQVIILRFINIGLFAWGLAAVRKLLVKTGAGRAIINLCLLAFVLIPVVSQLAAQINYDNLLLPVVAWALIVTIDLAQQLARRRPKLNLVLGLLILCLLGSLVKYAFLPIFCAIIIFLAIVGRRAYKGVGRSKFKSDLVQAWRQSGKRSAWLLVLAALGASVLFGERYGINLVRYHALVPDCSKVLTVKQCSAYGPWIRDYNFKINKVDEERSPFVYTADWFYGMWLRLFFALDGPASQFQTRGPLPVPAISAVIFAGGGLILIIKYGKRVYRRYNQPALLLLGLASILYIASLWLDEFKAYVQTGQPVAINGRYLFPVLLPVMLLLALAYKEWLGRRQNLQLALSSIFILSLLWGGGALTYILRGNNNWYWDSRVARDANHLVQNTIGPVTPGYYQQTDFLY